MFSDLFSYLNHSPSDVTQSHHYKHHILSDGFVSPVSAFQQTPDSIVATAYLTPLLQHLIGISILHFHMPKIQLTPSFLSFLHNCILLVAQVLNKLWNHF